MVLVGVLGAFVLEGWRDDRELRREVEQELRSVEGALRENQAAALIEIETLKRTVRGGEALIALIDSAGWSTTVSVPDTLLFLATVWHPTFNASLGAVDALLASGRLGEIRDPDLRLGLAGLDEVVADALEEEIFARSLSVEELAPLLDAVVVRPSFAGVLSELFGDEGDGASPQARGSGVAMPYQSDVELPTSLRIRNTINRRVLWQRAAIGEFRRLERRLGELSDLVAREIR